MVDLSEHYKTQAQEVLDQLIELKARKAALEKDIKLVESKVSIAFANGDLDYLKVEGSNSSLQLGTVIAVFNPGRDTYDYSNCFEIKQKEADLKALKQTAQAVGLAPKKTGSPFWTIRSWTSQTSKSISKK